MSEEESDQEQQDEEAEAAHQGFMLLVSHPKGTSKKGPTKKQRDYAKCGFWLALASTIISGGLLAAAIYVGWVYKGQLDAMQTANGDFRESLAIQERPWVLVSVFHKNESKGPDDPVSIEFTLRNFGKSPAFDIEFRGSSATPLGVRLPMDVGCPTKPIGGPDMMAPGLNYPGGIIVEDLSERGFASFVDSGGRPFTYGTVWYSDQFGETYCQDFCGAWNGRDSAFSICLPAERPHCCESAGYHPRRRDGK